MEIPIVRYSPEGLRRENRPVVDEKPYALTVNGRRLLTLIASPHDAEELVTGFLRLQGLIAATEDIVSLGICADSGQVAVAIRGDLPERLETTLTSGCGGGVLLDVPGAGEPVPDAAESAAVYPPDFVVGMMTTLFNVSRQYAAHGGIHSAALCGGDGLLLHAEDIGRHNTIDRIAGAALRQKVTTAGKLLLTSGRVSSEMALKAARLGVGAVASRTSPTDLAVRVCRQARIGLAGYVRNTSLEIFAHADRFGLQAETEGP